MNMRQLHTPDLMAYRQLGKIQSDTKLANRVWEMQKKGEVDLWRIEGDGLIGTVALCIDNGELLIYQAAGYDHEGRFCEKFKPLIMDYARSIGAKTIRAHTRKDGLARIYRRLFDKFSTSRGEYVFKAVVA